MKRCISCNKVLRDECRFCSQCGHNEFVSIPADIEEPESNPVRNVPIGGSESVSDASADTVIGTVTDTECKESTTTEAAEVMEQGQPIRKRASWGTRIFTWFLCIFITLFMILGSLFLLLRFSVSETAIFLAADGLDGKVSEIQVGFLMEGERDSLTLSEYVYDNMGFPYNRFISEDGIEDLLNEDFIREFVADRLSDYVSFVLYDKGDGAITADDIAELLDDNRRAFEKAAGCSLDDIGLYEIGYDIESEGILEAIDLAAHEREYRDVLSVIRILFSGIVEGIFLAVAAALIIWVLILRKDKDHACAGIAATFIITGTLHFMIVAATFILAGIANKTMTFGMDLYHALLKPIRLFGILEAAGLIILGLIFIFIAKLLKRKYNKNNSK